MIQNCLCQKYQSELLDLEKHPFSSDLEEIIQNIFKVYMKDLYEQASLIDKGLSCLINFFECITGKHYYTKPEKELISDVNKTRLKISSIVESYFKNFISSFIDSVCDNKQTIVEKAIRDSRLSSKKVLDMIFSVLKAPLKVYEDTWLRSFEKVHEAFKKVFPEFKFTSLDLTRISIARDPTMRQIKATLNTSYFDSLNPVECDECQKFAQNFDPTCTVPS